MRIARSIFSFAFACALISAAAAAADDGIMLKAVYKVDAVSRDSVAVKADMSGSQSFDITLETSSKITDVKANGNAKIETTQSNLKIGGKDAGAPGQPPENTEIDPFGRLITTDAPGDQQGSYVLARGGGVVFTDHAVKPGDTWTIHYDKEADKNLPESKTDYKFEKLSDDKKIATISWKYAETSDDPATSTGTADIFVDSGDVKSAQIEIDNMPFFGGAKAKHASVTITHID